MASAIPPRKVLVIEVEVPLDDSEKARNLLEKLRSTADACIDVIDNQGNFSESVIMDAVGDILRVSELLLRK